MEKLEPLKLERQWYNLKQACEVKGVNYKTILNNPHRKPNNGTPDGVVSGNGAWTRDSIWLWIHQTDKDMKELAVSKGMKFKTNQG